MRFLTGSIPKSEGLRFRLPAAEDAPFFFRLMTDPDYIRFISDAGFTGEDDAAAFIEHKALARFREFGIGLWVVEALETGAPIGVSGLIVRDELEYPDLGYAFLKAARGRGHARDAGHAVVALARTELGLDRLCAIAHPDNQRSATLLTLVGFARCGQRTLATIGRPSDYFEMDLKGSKTA